MIHRPPSVARRATARRSTQDAGQTAPRLPAHGLLLCGVAMNVAEGELAHGDGHQCCTRRVERERGIAGDETTEARPEHEGHARPSDCGCDADKRFPPEYASRDTKNAGRKCRSNHC